MVKNRIRTWLPRPDENRGAADGRKDPLDGKNIKLGTISSQAPKPVMTGNGEGSETRRRSVGNEGIVNLILLKV